MNRTDTFDEDGFCKFCGWNSAFAESHAVRALSGGCRYMESNYKVWVDDDGEVQCEAKQKPIMKKRIPKRVVSTK